jgi:hypothetical protein
LIIISNPEKKRLRFQKSTNPPSSTTKTHKDKTFNRHKKKKKRTHLAIISLLAA